MWHDLVVVCGGFSCLLTLFLSSLSVRAELHNGGILYPRASETRMIQSLDGLWNFAVSPTYNPFLGFTDYWYKKKLHDIPGLIVTEMPVPASYNDVTTDWRIRDHVGVVWYERLFFVPKLWSNAGRLWIRFGSVSYAAQVWINGMLVASHEIGHLPFVAEITENVFFGKENRVTVACDNTLLPDTIPQGRVDTIETGRLVQTYTFDFFNYAGIDRSVTLYTTPKLYIDDITIDTQVFEDMSAVIAYNIELEGDAEQGDNNTNNHVGVNEADPEEHFVRVSLLDHHNDIIATSDEGASLQVRNPRLWWPYLSHYAPGYMYQFQVELFSGPRGDLVDRYTLPIGIRSLTWTNRTLLLNHRPIYLHGFGRHEDSDIRGKGLDLPLIVRDYNLIKWIGANAFRTSHYPYAEEIMDLADSNGIMVIDECPSVNTEFFNLDSLLKKHKQSLSELIRRDKNRPSVIMWSAANEPRTQSPLAAKYFKDVIQHIRDIDLTRPTTIVEAQSVNIVNSSLYVDIISFNRYNGWYRNGGNLDVIPGNVVQEATEWFERFQKPVIMQEYGADTLEGLHFSPDFIWSEEYQVQLMSKHFEAFDILRSRGFFIGEFIWNFADFKTAQTYTRVGGNKKGIFTRNRQPKAGAHHLRKRYWSLATQLSNATMPLDLYPYVVSTYRMHEEL